MIQGTCLFINVPFPASCSVGNHSQLYTHISRGSVVTCLDASLTGDSTRDSMIMHNSLLSGTNRLTTCVAMV